jgi:hypothetical protein
MGNIESSTTLDPNTPLDSNVFMGMTIDEANSFVTNHIVYYSKEERVTNDQSKRITEVCVGDYKDIRRSPGNLRLRVETNPYGKIDKIKYVG